MGPGSTKQSKVTAVAFNDNNSLNVNYGLYGESQDQFGYGVVGYGGGNSLAGVLGYSPAGRGVSAFSSTGYGIYSTAPKNYFSGTVEMGYEVVTRDAQSHTATAYCPSNKHIVGGGCIILGAQGNIDMWNNGPEPNAPSLGWLCSWNPNGTYTVGVRATAICANIN